MRLTAAMRLLSLLLSFFDVAQEPRTGGEREIR